MAGALTALRRLVAGPAGSALTLSVAALAVLLAPAAPGAFSVTGALIALAASAVALFLGRVLEARLLGDRFWPAAMFVLVPVLALTGGGGGHRGRLGLAPVLQPVEVILGASLIALLAVMALLRLARRGGQPRFWASVSAGLIALLLALVALSTLPALAVMPEITGTRTFLATAGLLAMVPVALLALSILAGRGRVRQRHLPPRR